MNKHHTSLRPIAAAAIALALAACSDAAQSRGVQDADKAAMTTGPTSAAERAPARTAAVPAGTPTRASMIMQTSLPVYAALESCDVGEDRLHDMKQRMRDLASQQGVSAASFDAAFKAGLADARQSVAANTAAHPAESRKFCEKERGGF